MVSFISLHDALHQPVPHNVESGQFHIANAFYSSQFFDSLNHSAFLVFVEVDLGNVARNYHF